jgi:hypothetical protein
MAEAKGFEFVLWRLWMFTIAAVRSMVSLQASKLSIADVKFSRGDASGVEEFPDQCRSQDDIFEHVSLHRHWMAFI